MKEKEHIDKFFHDKLVNYEKEPPVEVWKAVSGKIGRHDRIIMGGFAWKLVAGMALLIASGLTLYFMSERPDTPAFNQYSTTETIPSESTAPLSVTIEKDSPEQVSKLVHKEIEEKSVTDGFREIEKEIIVENQIRQEVVSKDKTERETTVLLPEQFRSAAFSIIVAPPARRDRIPDARKSRPSLWKMLSSDIAPAELPASEKSNPWQIAALVAPEYSYRTLQDGPMVSAAHYNASETGLVNYSGTLQVGYQISKRLSIQSGLAYSRSGTKIENLNRFELVMNRSGSEEFFHDVNSSFIIVANSMGIIVSDSPDKNYLSHNNGESEKFRQNIYSIETLASSQYTMNDMNAGLLQYLDFIEMPVVLRYLVFDGKISLNLIGGLSSNLLVSNKVYLTTGEGRQESGRTENLRPLNLSGNVGLSLDYDLSDHFSLLFEPRYKHYLNSINEGGFIDAKPYMFGFFTGLKYSF